MIALALENAGLKCTLHGSDTFIAERADVTVSATPCGPLQALFATWQAVRGADYRDRIRPMQDLDLLKRPLFRGRAKKIHPRVARRGGGAGEHHPDGEKAANFQRLTEGGAGYSGAVVVLPWTLGRLENHRMTQR